MTLVETEGHGNYVRRPEWPMGRYWNIVGAKHRRAIWLIDERGPAYNRDIYVVPVGDALADDWETRRVLFDTNLPHPWKRETTK